MPEENEKIEGQAPAEAPQKDEQGNKDRSDHIDADIDLRKRASEET
jgi:hypothetical protein